MGADVFSIFSVLNQESSLPSRRINGAYSLLVFAVDHSQGITMTTDSGRCISQYHHFKRVQNRDPSFQFVFCPTNSSAVKYESV